jgi:hypothetical protein
MFFNRHGAAMEQLFFNFDTVARSKVVPHVERIEHHVAKPFIIKHHYSKNCPTGKNIFFGCFIGSELYAVADYGIGANMDGGASMARMTGKPVTRENHVTLKRLCRKGAKGASLVPMTQFLARCHKLLKRDHGVRFIISYADPSENGTVKKPEQRSTPWQAGGIYAAANFQYLGKVPAERHFKDRRGRFVHRRVPYRLMKREIAAGGKMTMPEAQAEMGLRPWTMVPKERWFLDLGK